MRIALLFERFIYMKKRNLFLLLFSIALGLFIVAFTTVYLLVLEDGEVPTDAPTSGATEAETEDDSHKTDHPVLLTNISESNLTAFSLGGYRYLKGEDGYYAEEFPDWPLDQAILSEMVTAFTQIYSTYLVDRSYGSIEYGFYTDDDPTFTIEDDRGGSIDLWIGEKCALDDRYYAASSFEDGIYLIDFDKTLLDYLPQYLLVMDAPNYYFEVDSLQSVVLKNSEGQVIHRVPEQNGEPLEEWEFVGHMGVSPNDIESGNPGNAQLAEWGLDPLHVLYAEIEFLDYENQLKKFECRFGKLTAEEFAGPNDVYTQYWIYVQYDKIVYRLPVSVSAEVASVLLTLQNG